MDNSIINKIVEACKNKQDVPLRTFGRFEIERKLGSGQQGIVFNVKNNINKQFALKFYHPTDKSPSILEQSIDRFINEVNTLASLNHKNIVKIYTGGFATWDESSEKWDVKEGFENINKEEIKENEFFYYLMDYIEGCDLSSLFPEFSKEDKDLNKAREISIPHRLELFENLIKQVSEAMIYYHNKDITHKDIKPENIRFCTEDSMFIIVDFGFAHHITSPQDDETITRVDYIDFPSIEKNDYEKNDMGQFAKMLSKILPSLKDEYKTNKFSGLNSSIEKGKNPNIAKRYKNMEEFYDQIKPYFLNDGGWKFQLKIDEFLTSEKFSRFDSKLRIPISESLLLSEELKNVIDTPEFQRLRGVRQLGPTMFVFPGANHTRFEHSLGVYSLSLRYLEKLLNFPDFRKLCNPIEDSIKLIVLSALLHDIGHYPYSHWVEEIDEFPRGIKLPSHEERARQILLNGDIGSVIKNEWKVKVEEVADLITDDSKREILNSFLSSIIDIDKLDYLYRDSVHCGVSYGKGIDIERLLDSLYVNTEKRQLCVTEKGQSTLLSILSARNIMYQAVYWHKTVRASEAMFKRFFYEYVLELTQGSLNNDEILTELDKLFYHSDDEFTAILYKWANSIRNKSLQELIQPFAYRGRKIYKPAYIYFDHNSENSSKIDKFFRNLLTGKYSYKDLIDKSNKFCESLKNHISDIKPLDIIFETTPIGSGEKYILDELSIYNTRKQRYDKLPIVISSLNDYLIENRQAYIFCHPRIYKTLKDLLLNTETFEKILNEVSKR